MKERNGKNRNLKFIVNIIVSLVVLNLCIFLLPKAIKFFMPFIVGWIISCIANPVVVLLEKKIKIKRKAGTVVVIVFTILSVTGLGYLVFSILFKQLTGLISDMPHMWSSMIAELNEVSKKTSLVFGIASMDIEQLLAKISDAISLAITELPSKFDLKTFEGMGSMLENIANVIIAIIMSMLSAYFFIADREWISKTTKKYLPISFVNKYKVFSNSLKQAVGGYFKAQFKIEVWIYIIILLGLILLDVKYAILIALLIAVLDFLPFFGTAIVFVPWAIISFLCGEYIHTIGFLVIWAGGQLVRQFIQPKIMGDSIGMDPIPTLFLLYIGYKFASVIGMIVAVPIGIIVANMNEAGFFDTPKYSLRILWKNIDTFRRLDNEDMKILEDKDKIS